jgi:hypothetical protein
MSERPICPCEGFIHPTAIFNPSSRNQIDYRVGDYHTFRRALLLSLTDENGNSLETELTNWKADGKGDLALQIVEWWAYLADILTFYSDRIANNTYLRTIDLPENIQRLIRILGYRPRPGIGASGVLAALTNNATPFTLPAGFQIQSKPGPGKQPQIFELNQDTIVGNETIQLPDVVSALPTDDPSLIVNGGVLLKGTVTSVKVGDRLLLLEKDWDGTDRNYALVTVREIKPEKNPQGKVNTRIVFTNPPNNLIDPADTYRLLKSSQFTSLWTYPSTTVITNSTAELNNIVRQIQVGDPVLFEVNGEIKDLVKITGYAEKVWYANAPDPSRPEIPPTGQTIPIPIPHTQISFIKPDKDEIQKRAVKTNYQFAVATIDTRSQTVIRFAWQEVGQIIATPTSVLNNNRPQIALLEPLNIPPNQSPSILLEDADGKGLLAQISTNLQLSELSPTDLELKSPLQLLLNLLPVSRGETVNNEILGSGNASIPGQEFVLQKSPLTYLLSDESTAGENYQSTLRIWVNDIEWQEVPSFYGQPAKARIFVTREDEEQKTHVLFGDGINGERLPSGIDNIIAFYRFGSGKEAPDPGTLNVIVKPYPNLKSIRNPLAVSGGADPDPPAQIRRYAPRSILTFGRAVSGDDYETIAAQTPGVARAKSYWTWDTEEQRTLVVVYVGDDASAVNAARIALKNSADPNRPILVNQAIALPIQLNLSLQIDPTYLAVKVIANTKLVLLAPDRGLFGIEAIRIGQSIYQSQIYAACMSVPGVMAVRALEFYLQAGSSWRIENIYRHDPGEGRFYQLQLDNLNITPAA